ncbi:MAG: hypothetical protein NZ695_04835 [Dehalococcoidia bacterium]|nr:hypothetical protein [Dehalococcoidia bacterium]
MLVTLAGAAGLVWAVATWNEGPSSSPGTVGTSPSPTVAATAVSPAPASPTPSPSPAPSPTAVPPRNPTATVPARVVESVRVLYTTCEGDGACGLMASGRRVHAGAAACNPSLAPFGTRLRILGWEQELVCEDIHPTLQGWYVVVWFATEAEGQAFRQRVGNTATVEVLYVPPR